MRINIIKSVNAISYYGIKDVVIVGKRTTKTAKAFGTYEEIKKKIGNQEPEQWVREQIKALNAIEKEGKQAFIAKLSSAKQIPKGEGRLYGGGYLFLQALYHRLDLHKVMKRIEKQHQFEYDLSAIFSMLIYTRLLKPSSKRTSVATSQAFLEPPKCQLHQMYRALEVLAVHSDEIQAALYASSKRVIPRDKHILYYDCTNYYFEIENEDDFRKYGKSKENRPNPIVSMGLFMDAQGLPLAFRMFEGNRNEQVTMRPLEETILSQFGMARIIVCTDAGLDSNANRVFNDVYGRNFVVTQSLKRLKKDHRLWALKRTGWLLMGEPAQVDPKTKQPVYYDLGQINENDPGELNRTYYKEIWLPAEDKSPEQKLIVTYSVKYKHYLAGLREEHIKRALKKLSKPSEIGRKRSTDPARFIETINATTEGEVAEAVHHYLNEVAILEEAEYDGYYAMCTNLDEDADMVVRIAEGRWEIESCSRTMKSDLEARPCYLSRKGRIEAHFLTCFIALLFQRILHKKVSQLFRYQKPSPMDVVHTLREMNFLLLPGEGYIPTYTRTNITDALHQIFGFRTDREIIPNKTMKEIIRSTKK